MQAGKPLAKLGFREKQDLVRTPISFHHAACSPGRTERNHLQIRVDKPDPACGPWQSTVDVWPSVQANLEKQVEELEESKEALEAEIAEQATIGDFTKVHDLTVQLGKLTNKLEYSTDRWVQLAERAEGAAV